MSSKSITASTSVFHQIFNAKMIMYSLVNANDDNIYICNKISKLDMKNGTITASIFGDRYNKERTLSINEIKIIGTTQHANDMWLSDK
jgi:hypothetical protein